MMLSRSTWTWLGLLVLGSKASPGGDHYDPKSYAVSSPPGYDHVCYGKTTIFETKTIVAPTTVPVTHYVDVKVSQYVTYTVSSTTTSIVEECITEYTTKTLHFTVNVTETDVVTITNTLTATATTTATVPTTVTDTDSETITNTQTTTATVPTTITTTLLATTTNTKTTTATVPATVTTYTTETIFSTTYDPCPSTCSISAATVNLYFWPTNRPYSYPSTYVDQNLGYTFTSPSVYMLIPTAKGTNSLGSPVGPSTSNWMLPLNLGEVSTIVDGTVTRQLTLSDLGTDCPQTAEPSAIATMVDSRCDPILAAPRQVSSWAYPCNACGRFGLFDPPYAVPTLTGGLVETPKTTPLPVQTTAPPPSTSALPATTPVSSPASSPSQASATSSSSPSQTVVPSSATSVEGGFAWLVLTVLSIALLL